MTSIVTWLISILSIVLVGTVADLLLANNRMGKYVKSVFASLTILVIILPLPNLIRNGINFDTSFIFNNEIVLDNSFLDYANRVRLSSLARGVESQLAADGVRGGQVSIIGTASNTLIEIDSVRINIENVVIDGIMGNINRSEHVANLVMGYLNIERGRIIIYGS